MNKDTIAQIPSFLNNEPNELDYSIFKLNLYLNAYNDDYKPYKINYQVLLMSYHGWKGSNLEEFCQNHTLGYFLLNPTHDSVEAREAFCLEIMEFLSRK